MKMLEKVARALARTVGRDIGQPETEWRDYLDDARAVLQAMREPSSAMGGRDARHAGYAGDIEEAWTHMIDEALRDEP